MAEEKDEILEGVLLEFEKLSAIPRPSGHERAVSDFLKKYLTDLGFSVTQDEVCNIITDVPASKGFEKAPLTVLQGHMDMVCVAEVGRSYDPLKDAIHLKRTSEFLEACGTSLGADDGIGVAVAIYIARTAKEHGPIRLIFTVDEERGMTGAIHLADKHLADVDYLINCDSENVDELTVGSAGSVDLTFRREISKKTVQGKRCYALEVKGLRGGHSGERIGDGRGNAIRTLAMTLLALQKEGTIELVQFEGGTARNAIPSHAKSIFATDMDESSIKRILEDQKHRFLAIYGNADPSIEFSLTETATDAAALTTSDACQLLHLLAVLHTGTYAMSKVTKGIETSANLGVVRMEENSITVEYFPRSSIDEKVDEFCIFAETIGALTGFTAEIGTQSPGWKENKESRLAKIMCDVFEEQNKKPMKVSSIHAGLECGWHMKKNPKIDMVSIGVTTRDIHSPKEHLLLSTVTPEVCLIEEVLKRIAKS